MESNSITNLKINLSPSIIRSNSHISQPEEDIEFEEEVTPEEEWGQMMVTAKRWAWSLAVATGMLVMTMLMSPAIKV